MKTITPSVRIAPAILLVIAVGPLPYGYYIFMRIVICGAAGLIAYFGYKERPVIQIWSVPFALIAILFNPVIPIQLTRPTWFYIDLAAAAVFVAHSVFVRQKFKIEKKSN